MRFALLACALVTGCASELAGPVYVDRDFSPAEEEQIRQAADAWAVASNGGLGVDLVFGVDVAPTRGSAYGRRILARVNDSEIADSELQAVQDGAVGDDWQTEGHFEILSVVPSWLTNGLTMRGVLLHEFGHHFMNGGSHTADPASLMFGAPFPGDRAPDEDRFVRGQCVTAADVAQFRSVGIGSALRVCP